MTPEMKQEPLFEMNGDKVTSTWKDNLPSQKPEYVPQGPSIRPTQLSDAERVRLGLHRGAGTFSSYSSPDED